MFRNRIFLKSLAIFFVLETLGSTVWPTISYALTSGPTAPEATSFEPVDTTDMVNTITGDFAYNMPLLEVPGPSGGYPISLSYHGGIQPNVDASWVGLGWTLNPGAINRLTNGLPDDFNGSQSTNHIFWNGGEMTQYTVGVSVGIANAATVSAGLTWANDTYKGRGVGSYNGVGVQLGNTPLAANATWGVSPYGDSYSSTGIGLSIGSAASEGMKISANVGVSFNSDRSVGFSGGVSWSAKRPGSNGSFGGSLLGASISTSGTKPSLGVGGFSASVNNSKAGKISTEKESFHVDIPCYYFNLHLGRDYVRYWMDQSETYENFGSLFFPAEDPGDTRLKMFDAYHIPGTESLSSGNNPAKYLEGSFADYDVYNVSAQGIGGNIQPYHYDLSLSSQDIESDDEGKEVLGYHIPQHSIGVEYRFMNDFSNRVLNASPEIETNQTLQQYFNSNSEAVRSDDDYQEWKGRSESFYTPTQNIPLFFPYGDPITGIEGYNSIPGTKRRIPHVPGSKHIEYFLNSDIISSSSNQSLKNSLRQRGFMDCNALGFTRATVEGNVGGFAITNESGVTYHFSLPAYSYNEYVYQQNTVLGKTFNYTSQKGKYAYTWYLTGMSGPDYVDRGPDGNPDGIMNDFDWGYWVEFQYGKWTDSYEWRNPSEGFNTDIDHRFKSSSMGKKEVYYLNAIKTKSHTAFFVKEMRTDGKGSVGAFANTNLWGPILANTYPNVGNFLPVKQTESFQSGRDDIYYNSVEWYVLPKASLSLRSIVLLKNEDIANTGLYANLSNKYNNTFTYKWKNNDPNLSDNAVILKTHLGQNVLDVHDVESSGFPTEKAIRKIDFVHDYSLAKGTSNSFDEGGKLYECGTCIDYIPNSSLAQVKSGKLTLKSIVFKGKNGAESLPPIEFNYDYTNPIIASGNVVSLNSVTKILDINLNSLSEFNKGDIILFNQGTNEFYGFIKDKGANLTVKIISPSFPIVGSISGFKKTKNPPYNKDNFDMWGLYKVDYVERDNYNISRFPSQISALNNDVWSLREVQSIMGSKIKIEYESDTYNKSVYYKNLNLALKMIPSQPYYYDADGYVSTFTFQFEATVYDDANIDLTKLYKVGDPVYSIAEFSVGELDRRGKDDGVFASYQDRVIKGSVVKKVTPTKLTVDVTFQTKYDNTVYMHIDKVQAGRVFLGSLENNLGGGLRVKSIGIFDPMKSQTRSTFYQYEFDGVSSGLTSYAPIALDDIGMQGSVSYKKAVYTPIIELFRLAREIPAPAVYYGKVRIGERIELSDGTVQEIPGYSEYEFETYNEGMVGVEYANSPPAAGSGSFKNQTYSGINKRKVSIKNYTQRLGALKSITLYDKEGNKINETINHYLHDEQTGNTFPDNSSQYSTLVERYNSQGVIQETFNHARWVKMDFLTKNLNGIISKKENYPSIQTGTTTINYKTGVKTESKNLAFDFYSGKVIKTLDSDGYGNYYVSEVKPAYNFYQAMGLKAYYNGASQVSNKHMIDQEAGSVTYKVEPVDNTKPIANDNYQEIGLIGSSTQTWSDQVLVLNQTSQPGIWRKHASYSFIGGDNVLLQNDGLYPVYSYTEFNAWNKGDATPTNWQKNNEITLYDVNSHALEASDMNNQFAATKFDSEQERVFATAANATYNEFAYSGAEDEIVNGNFGGNVVQGGEVSAGKSHTGAKSLKVTGALGTAFKFAATACLDRQFQVSVWSDRNDGKIKYRINGGDDNTAILSPLKKAGHWYLLSAVIPQVSKSSTIVVWCEATSADTYFDDFRIHPLDAAMTSYVYNQWGELSHVLDNNNLFTEYKYDGMGRLKETYKESFQSSYGNQGVVKVSEVNYNYGVNHPYQHTITASVTGSTGKWNLPGSTTVANGGEVKYEVQKNGCSSPLLSSIYVDNKLLNMSVSKTTLPDGTEIHRNGYFYTFKKVASSHTFRAVFYSYAGQGYATCYYDANGCQDGSFEYFYYNPCGTPGTKYRVYNINDVPSELRAYLPEGGCPPTSGTNCGPIIEQQ